jgi:ribosome-associated protein
MDLLDEKKAIDYFIMDLKEVNSYLEYFLIVTGNSHVHCKSLTKDLRKIFNEGGYKEKNRPEYDSSWIVLDFGEIIIHIFTQDTKDYYQLDKLWADAKFIQKKDLDELDIL